MEAFWWEGLTEGKLCLVLMGGAMFSKSLIQFSVGGLGCVPSLLLDLRPNYGGGNEDNGYLLQKIPLLHSMHPPWSGPPLTRASARDSWTPMGMSGSVSWGSLLLSPGSWCTQAFVCALQESVSSVLIMFWHFCGGVNGNLLQEGLCHTQVCCTQSPCPCSLTSSFTISMFISSYEFMFPHSVIYLPTHHFYAVIIKGIMFLC